MKDKDKPKEQLINELAELRQRIAEWEASETKRKQMEEALRESEQKFRDIVEQSHDGIVLINEEGTIIEWNQGLERTTRLDRAKVLGRNYWDIQFQLEPEERKKPELYEQLKTSTLELLRTGQAPWLNQLQERDLRCADGILRVFQQVVFPIKTSKGFMVGAVIRDITERRQAEEELKIKDNAIASSITGIATAEFAGNMTYVNPSFLRMWGYDDESEVLGSPAVDFWEAREKAWEVIEELRDGGSFIGELVAKRKDGLLFDVQLSASVVADETGKAICMMASFVDISERKRAERALRESEDKYRQLFELESDAIFLVDNETGRILEANTAASALYGYTREELLCKKNSDLSAEPEETSRVTQTTPVIADQVVVVPLRFHRKKDGTVFPVEITGRFFTWRGRSVHIAATRDITERKRAEEALRESEEKFRILAEQLPNMIFINKQGKVVYANERCEEIMGYTRDEFYSVDFDFVTLIAPEYRELVQASFNTHAEGKEVEPLEYTLVAKDGRRIEAIHNTRLIDYEGERAILGIVTDITERKRAEEQIKASLREKEVLLQEIHHRVRNNLQVISSLLDLQADSIQDPKVLEVFQDSQNRVRAMALIHEQLYESKDMARIDMAGYMRNLTSNLRQSYGAYAIVIKINVADIALDIDTASPCGLLIHELVSNSLKHAFPPEEEGLVGPTGEICIALRPDDDQLELIVSDNGVGLPSDVDLESPKSLGLRLVNLFIRQLEGTMELDRSHGTAFKITFAAPKHLR